MIADSLMLLAGLPRYLLCVAARVLAVLTAWLAVNWFLPIRAVRTEGWVNNRERQARDLFVAADLWEWSTNDDNALTGDDAHKRRHADPETYWAMLCWVSRNPAQGFSWGLLGAPVAQHQIKRTWYGWRMGSFFKVTLPGNLSFGWLIDSSAPGRVPDERAFFVLGR